MEKATSYKMTVYKVLNRRVENTVSTESVQVARSGTLGWGAIVFLTSGLVGSSYSLRRAGLLTCGAQGFSRPASIQFTNCNGAGPGIKFVHYRGNNGNRDYSAKYSALASGVADFDGDGFPGHILRERPGSLQTEAFSRTQTHFYRNNGGWHVLPMFTEKAGVPGTGLRSWLRLGGITTTTVFPDLYVTQ